MRMIMTFLPWLAFWMLLSCDKLFVAIVVALAASVAAIVIEKISRRNTKILQIGTLAVFLAFAIVMIFVDQAWLGDRIRLMSSIALTLIVLTSILVGKPFTLQYARESVPKEYWDSAEFLHANYVITWVWFAAFVANTIATGLNYLVPSINVLVSWAISVLPFLAAAKFTAWYSKRSDA